MSALRRAARDRRDQLRQRTDAGERTHRPGTEIGRGTGGTGGGGMGVYGFLAHSLLGWGPIFWFLPPNRSRRSRRGGLGRGPLLTPYWRHHVVFKINT